VAASVLLFLTGTCSPLREVLLSIPSAYASDVTVATASPKTWSAAPSQATYRSLFRTTNNELIVLYSDTGHLYYRKSADNGGSWGSATQIKYNDDFTGYDFDAFMDGSNNLYVAYRPTRGTQSVFMVKLAYSAGAWTLGTERTVESAGSTQQYPSIVVEPSGKIWVSYSYFDGSSYTIVVKNSTDDGASWSAATTLTSTSTLAANYSTMAIYNGQYPVIAYVISYAGSKPVRSRAFNGSSWTSEVTLDSANNGAVQNFSLTSVGNQVVYAGANPGVNTAIQYAFFNGTSWSATATVNTSASDTYDPQVVSDGTNVWLFYGHKGGTATAYDLYYRKYDGASWSASGTLTSGAANNRYPHVPRTVAAGAPIPYVYQSGTAAPFTLYGNSVATTANAPAGRPRTANYQFTTDVIAVGGGEAAKSNNYVLDDSIGEPNVGPSRTANYDLNAGYRQTTATYLSVGCSASVDLGTVAGTGQRTGSGSCVVVTDAEAGYTLSWAASGASLASGADTIAPYAPSTPNVPENWSVPANQAAWGGRLRSASTDAAAEWGTDGASEKWLNVSAATRAVVTRHTRTSPAGSLEVVQFRAEIGPSVSQPPGLYRTTIIITVTSL
jgi:hypothetical protein